MATASDETYSYEVLTPFQVFIHQIALEITSTDVKVIKSLLTDKIPREEVEQIDINKVYSGVDVISTLLKYRLIAPNDFRLLKDLLKVVKSEFLLSKVEKFEKIEKNLDDAPIAQIEMIRQAGTYVDLYLVISCKREQLSALQIDELKKAIERDASESDVESTDVHVPYIIYLSSRENESDKNTTVVTFQFPKHPKETAITEKLQLSAINKESWLTDNGVVQLKVNGKSSINIKESVDFKVKDVEDEVFLATKPELQAHSKNVVDVILVVEMPHSVTPHACKEVLNMCHSAVQEMSETSGLDINLAIIQYGNHTSSSSNHVLIVQDFCKEFDVKSKLKANGQCGSEKGGNSGMADALSKVVELTKKGSVRPEASKVCILLSFSSRSNKGLKHYSSHNGNDIIETTNALAKCKIPVYIFGADYNQGNGGDIEECFLSGVAHIGGGRYFGMSDKLISDVLKHEVAVENEEQTAGEVTRDAVNSNYGDTNDIRLAESIVSDKRYKKLKFGKLLENGRSLEPISQVANRIAFADDLNDAIEAIKRFKLKEEQFCSQSRGTLVAPPLGCSGFIAQSYSYPKMSKQDKQQSQQGKVDVAKVPQDFQEMLTEEERHHLADLEMASRVVRRHLYRMAYYKKNP